MLTITNSFHGTTTRVRAKIGTTLTPDQSKRAWRALCGHRDCQCSGPAGSRGPQDGFVLIDGPHGVVIEPTQ